ncbi:MAG TPA: FAD-binding oxidoreductase [Dongiaceae bacterium]|nr:FAD-binding oxidoreductase [Dongiaceae bacterium]
MAAPALRNRSGAPISSAIVDALGSRIAGQVVRPQDSGYDDARRIWNAAIERYPGLVVRCAGTADVVQAVSFARANDLLVAVRGGGHNVAGRALCDDGVVIDLSAMKAVLVDPLKKTVRVQGGATLGDVDRETHVFGLAVPAGVVSRTGIAGLSLGGGVGWLVRKYGLTCDNVLSCEVVTAEGKVLTASAHENADLFWALRGGGGNFGVVTSFLFRAHPVETVLGGLIVHARDQARDVIRHYRDFMVSAPEELTAYAALITTPDGHPAVAVIPCYCGELAEGERVIGPLRKFGSPLADAVQPMPFPVMQRILDGAFPDGTHNYWKSTFVKELSDDAIDVIVAHADKMRSPLSAVVLEYYGGAASRVGVSETAFAQRRAEYDIGFMAQWTDPAEKALHVAWAQAMSDALAPFSSRAYLLNFVDAESPDTIRAAFGANYARLAEVKKRYDPTNFFRINQNIVPAD